MSKMMQSDQLIMEFSADYIEKIYYFCLKRISDDKEAEDLAADISYAIIKELRKGVIPNHFSAWVWKIARNSYSKWADKKQKAKNRVSDEEIEDLAIADEVNLDNDLIKAEDLSLMRRELAFTTSEYRNILVAYYLHFRSLKDIAQSLGLPVGTVKSKLSRSRNKLKEGIEMAREFGMLSYNPENVSFVKAGVDGDGGEPWSLIGRLVCKNILIAAYRTPSTAEELAMELGIALPYLEEELQFLIHSGLIKQNGKKYETNILIMSAKAQENIYNALASKASLFTKKIIELIEYQIKCYEENGYQWHEGYQSFEDMKWALLMIKFDEIHTKLNDKFFDNYAGYTKREDGGRWDLLGFEEYNGPQYSFVGMHGSGRDGRMWQYKFNLHGIASKTPIYLTESQDLALVAIAENEYDGSAEPVVNELIELGYVEKVEDEYKPTFMVTIKDKIGQLTDEQSAQYDSLFNETFGLCLQHYIYCQDVVKQEIPSFLKNDQHQIDFACLTIFDLRGAIIEEALKAGYITYAEDDERQMLGTFLEI